MKKRLQLFALSLLVQTIQAQENVQVDAINYSVHTYYSGTTREYQAEANSLADSGFEGTLVIPDSIPYRDKKIVVYSIRQGAFATNSGIISIVIPNTISAIYSNTFYGCTNLQSVIMPPSVESIGPYAFYGCTALTELPVTESIQSIGASAFHETTWYNQQLEGVVYAGQFVYSYKGAMPENCEIVVKEGTIGIADAAFYNNAQDPETREPLHRFDNLCSVSLPNTIKTIGNRAFYMCDNLQNLNIPTHIKIIGSEAFYNCQGLSTLIFPSTLEIWRIGFQTSL